GPASNEADRNGGALRANRGPRDAISRVYVRSRGIGVKHVLRRVQGLRGAIAVYVGNRGDAGNGSNRKLDTSVAVVARDVVRPAIVDRVVQRLRDETSLCLVLDPIASRENVGREQAIFFSRRDAQVIAHLGNRDRLLRRSRYNR